LQGADILPAIAAVGANPELQATVYFGTPSGTGADTGAADITFEAGSGVHIRPVREPRVHAKILAWDDDFIVISSQNWLSADSSENNKQKEIGVFIHAAGAARHVIDFFEDMREGVVHREKLSGVACSRF
jgi:cardiolipin synthase